MSYRSSLAWLLATSFDARPNEVYMKAQLAKALPQHRILTQEMRIGSVLEACPPSRDCYTGYCTMCATHPTYTLVKGDRGVCWMQHISPCCQI